MTDQTRRPTFEAAVHARLLALPNVSVIPQCDVVGVTTDPSRDRVIGVRMIRCADGSAEEVVPAALVVDAAGRCSRAPPGSRLWATLRPPRIRCGSGSATRPATIATITRPPPGRSSG